MQSSFNILSALYDTLNVPDVTSQISGIVTIGEPRLTSQKEDIQLKVQNFESEYVTNGKCEVIIFLPVIETGVYNLSKFKSLVELLIQKCQSIIVTNADGNFYFQYSGEEGTVKDDLRRDNMSSYTIYLDYQTL